MTAAQIQLREELFYRLTRRLGLNCERQHIAIFSNRGDAVMSVGIGRTMTIVKMPWSEIHRRQPYQDMFEIAVLNGLLREGIYGCD